MSRQLEDPRQLRIHGSAPWEQLPYHCRIDWTKEGTEVLKQRSLAYIRSQPDDNTYYTYGSSDGTRVAAAVVHKTEEMTVRLNDSISARGCQWNKEQGYNTHRLLDSGDYTKE